MHDDLKSAIQAAFSAGYERAIAADDRLLTETRKNHLDKSQEYEKMAWIRLATIPGEIGEAARTELARIQQ